MKTITLNIEDEVYRLIKMHTITRAFKGEPTIPDLLAKNILQGISEEKSEITLKLKNRS